MIIFVDVVFIENFIINLFFLYITAQTMKIDINLKKVILSSLLGAVYVVVLLYFKFKFLTYFSVKILVAFFMIKIAYGKKNILYNLKSLIIFVFYSMVLAGVCLFLQLNKVDMYEANNITLANFSNKKLFLSLMILYIFVNRIIIYVKSRKALNNLIYEVEIVTDKYNKVINGFLDTGNELREPVTNLPVIIVERSELPFKINDKDKLYIPYKAVNGESGKLEAFKPLYINIYENKSKKEKKQVVIALCEEKLSKEDDYNALLSRGIFE